MPARGHIVRLVAVSVVVATLSILPSRSARAGSVQPLPPVTDADGRLGLCNVLPGASPVVGASWASLAAAAGARVNRWEFRWDRIEPQPGAWDYSKDDLAVDSSQTAGLDVLGILIGTPGWAAAPGQRPGNGLPRGLGRGIDDPQNLWAAYVRQTVTHYGSLVRWWEIWNEPDLQFFWSSSPEDYFRLLKVSYLVIRANSNAKVMMAGMVVPDLAFMRRVLDAADRDPNHSANGGYFDVAAWHAYGPARSLYDNLRQVRRVLDGSGFGASPIWVTEDGFPASNPNGEDRQAAYVLQTALYAFAAGADHLLVYRASDDSTAKSWGLLSSQAIPRHAYLAFQLAAHFLSHARAVVYAPTANLERFTIFRPNQRVTVIWTRGVADRSITLSVEQPNPSVMDWNGRSSSIRVSSGQARIVAPGAIYNRSIDPAGTVVGGPPLFEIEDNSVPSSAPVQTLLPPMTGPRRRLVLFNPRASSAVAIVSAASAPSERLVVQLAPGTLQLIDLDLLAGNSYAGAYSISSTAPLSEEAVSGGASVGASTPSTHWLVPASPRALTISNASPTATHISLVAYSSSGTIASKADIRLPGSGSSNWSLPIQAKAHGLSLMVDAGQPISLSGPRGAGVGVPEPQTVWYAIRPGDGKLVLFNPSATQAQVNVRFVGSPELTAEQLKLAPYGSFRVSTHNARAIVVSSATGIVAGAAPGSQTSTVGSDAVTATAIAAAGSTTGVNMFNPSQQAAHVTLSLMRGGLSSQVTAQVAPLHVRTVQIRAHGTPAGGVVVNSDVPVVTTTR
jgi:Glycosyl hydrolase catalytic core